MSDKISEKLKQNFSNYNWQLKSNLRINRKIGNRIKNDIFLCFHKYLEKRQMISFIDFCPSFSSTKSEGFTSDFTVTFFGCQIICPSLFRSDMMMDNFLSVDNFLWLSLWCSVTQNRHMLLQIYALINLHYLYENHWNLYPHYW